MEDRLSSKQWRRIVYQANSGGGLFITIFYDTLFELEANINEVPAFWDEYFSRGLHEIISPVRRKIPGRGSILARGISLRGVRLTLSGLV